MNRARTSVFAHGLIINPDATAGTVVMLHHAGATASSLLSFARKLPHEYRYVLVDRPGRGVRSKEPQVHSFAAVVDDLETTLASFLDGPFILFGHSMGAMLAHEVAVLAEQQRHGPRTVVLSGTHPTRSGLVDLDLSSTRIAAEQLRLLGGTPAEVLADPTLLELAAATLAEDTAILRTFDTPTRIETSSTDYRLWLGAEDPTLTTLDTSLWFAHASVDAQVQLFQGGHFYLFEDTTVVGELSRLISNAFDLAPDRNTHSSFAFKEKRA